MPQRPLRPILTLALGFGALFHYSALLVPWPSNLPTPALHPSWVYVVTEAFVRDWQWGTDIVFTYGPLGFLMLKLPHPETLAITLSIWALIAVTEVAAIVQLTSGKRLGLRILVYVLVSFLTSVGEAGSTEVLFFSLPVLAALLWTRSGSSRSTLIVFSLVALAALGALIKTSLAIAPFVAFLVIDVHQIAQRRPPVLLPLFAGTFLALYAAAGQDLLHLWDHIRNSAELVAGYSAAMGRAKNAWELPLHVAVSGCIFFWLFGRLRRHPDLPRSTHLILASIWIVSWFMAMKARFTREGPEDAYIAWASLVLTSVFPTVAFDLWSRRTRPTLVASTSIAIAVLFSLRPVLEHPAGVIGRFAFRSVAQQSSALAALAVEPEAWLARHAKRWEDQLASIRRRTSLGPIRGTLDVVPSLPAVILAHGFAYRPRPVFEEYSAYSERLQELNREYLARPDGTAAILFRPGSIDFRYPSMVESTSWPILLGSFVPRRLLGHPPFAFVLLEREEEPLPVPLVETGSIEARLKDWIALPPDDTVFVKIDIQPTLLGKLAALLFRPPVMWVKVEAENGRRYRHRYIEAIGRAGFLLSPHIHESRTFAALAFGRPDLLTGERVKRMKFRADLLTRACYRSDVRIRWFRLDLSALRQREMPLELAAALESGGDR